MDQDALSSRTKHSTWWAGAYADEIFAAVNLHGNFEKSRPRDAPGHLDCLRHGPDWARCLDATRSSEGEVSPSEESVQNKHPPH